MRIHCLVMAVAAVFVAAAPSRAESCTQCHGDEARLLKVANNDEARAARAYVDLEKAKKSVHGSLACDECHQEFVRYPHPEQTRTMGCGDCHEVAAQQHAASVHGTVTPAGAEDQAVGCADCHGVHDTLKPAARDSRLGPLNITRTCGACHFEGIDAKTATTEELLKQPFCDDTHGRALLIEEAGDAPTCASCHGAHDTKKQTDPASRIARANVSKLCADCHTDEAEQYRLSVHGVAQGDGKEAAATCTDCHPPHLTDDKEPESHLAFVKHCAECHEQRLDSFRSSRHGKITSLGFGDQVADCASCHGNHDTRRSDDPHSRIHPDNLVKTCVECHAGAHEEFVKYKVHAVWVDRDSEDFDPFLHIIYAAIHALLIGVLIFGFVHIALWLVRATFAGDWKNRARGGRTMRRWRPFYVQLHVVFMCSFLLLAATGLPMFYSGQDWARRLMLRLGGPQAAAWVHRVSAIIMLACIALYLIHIAHRFFVRREKGIWTGPHTMLPRGKDFADFFGTLRWFVFLGKRPRFDRWTYWEKLDFWSVFWGIAIIGATGLVLWFPEAATLVMPAWVINVSAIVHGHEALLAVVFIFTFHVFHASLRPDKFPMDPMFFTGRLAEEELKHDRPMEYERARNDGTLDAMEDAAPGRATLRFAYLLGLLVMISGIVLVILMFTVPD